MWIPEILRGGKLRTPNFRSYPSGLKPRLRAWKILLANSSAPEARWILAGAEA
jgi:hypothetical protein